MGMESGVSNARPSRQRRGKGKSPKPRKDLKWIPLGGMGEIGKNVSVLQYGDEMVVIDCGLKFPEEEMLGIDLVIPDVSFLEENRDKIKGIFITHGHEDHIGALPFVLPKLDVPVYGTRLTLGLIKNKLGEVCPRYRPKFNEISAGDSVTLGSFTVRAIAVCHSIPDGLAYAVKTPVGTVVHTGDFKLDNQPIDGRTTDYGAFAELGREGVLLMLSDSTNVEREGFTPSERTVGRTLEQLFRLHKDKRIVIATFASNLHRAQQVFNIAMRYNRKVALVGRSMLAYVELARELGYVNAPEDLFVPAQEADRMSPNRVVVLTTGSQGEPFSGLVLMSKGEHRQIRLGQRDLVIISATPIPGNEKLVSRTINMLFSCGCEVVYERDQAIHVSGHASREELKMMISLIKPKCFAPVHGEYRHLVRHAQLARDLGVPSKEVFVLSNGDVLTLTSQGKGRVDGRVQAGAIMVDGLAMGEFQGSLLKERRELALDGVLAVSVLLGQDGSVRDVKMESRGFLHSQEAKDLYGELERAVIRALESCPSGDESAKTAIRKRMREVLSRYSRGYPSIIPLINRL
ncbi:putative hydrolase of the metallo-beta-lactamase superfamily [Thermanaerovibrio velox DSM 12556]|uniref:Ribonuclease J n=1 Tax=Thermanaerovibrio velox DSM 12556 TaxID=926567 RepID=H0UNN3_9BACT|nr:ribonuclease J [Thermanaerovibrio velox]EHM10448.1 putative hydrolase of the metallo-beta-lactamase superfamily [Thermanaerovibrio velox DSM 12556]